ncbi:MAG: hypothetical protein ACRD5H_10265, partial [Nitrososphaerales archaeon]
GKPILARRAEETKMKKQQKPTRLEVAKATEAQAPPCLTIAKREQNEFSTLQQSQTRDASTLLGGEKLSFLMLQEKPKELFLNDSDVSLPFFITRCWIYESKTAMETSRIAFRIVTSTNEVYGVALPYKLAHDGTPLYADRADILKAFQLDSRPIGLIQFQGIDRGFGTPYFRLIYASDETIEMAGLAIDKEIPF